MVTGDRAGGLRRREGHGGGQEGALKGCNVGMRHSRHDLPLPSPQEGVYTEHSFFETGAGEGAVGEGKGEGEGEGKGSSSSVGSVVVTVVLNPLTEAAQRVAPLLMVLRDQLQVPLRLLLVPDIQLTEFPLQKFYRYVVGADVGEVSPGALFSSLPRHHILTMRMDVPEAWNVQSIRAIQDVDNLRCDDVTCGSAPDCAK